jgi:hypothetical protein
MTPSPAPRARKPALAPTKTDLDERNRHAKLAMGSIDTVRASAQTWRTGLAAFITLVTTGVIIKGPETTNSLAVGWRAVITVLIGGGLLLALVGLWQALAAEAGTDPKKQTLQDIRAAHDTLTAYEVYLAAQAADRLQWGRRAVGVAVLFLLVGIGITWCAPTAAPSSPVYVMVVHGHAITCGIPQPAAAGQLGLTVNSGRDPVLIPFTQITSLALATACPP